MYNTILKKRLHSIQEHLEESSLKIRDSVLNTEMKLKVKIKKKKQNNPTTSCNQEINQCAYTYKMIHPKTPFP
jgi:hypothetical protein